MMYSKFKGIGKTYLKMYIKTKEFFENIYKIYQQVFFPNPLFYQFTVNNIYLITRKEYEIKKINVTERINFNSTKLYYEIDIKKYFDDVKDSDYLEMECKLNEKICRFISSEAPCNKLSIPLGKHSIRDASSILYAELHDHYLHEKKDVTQIVRQYYRGTKILDSILNEYDNDNEIGEMNDDDDGCLTIDCPNILEKMFTIPRKNSSSFSLKLMKI